MFDIEKVQGIGGYEVEDLNSSEEGKNIGIIYKVPGGKAFLVVNLKNDSTVRTVEVRTDANLAKLLSEKYESVMQSRYFGRGGIEVVMSGQLKENEIEDLVRLSYNMTIEK